LKGVPVSADDLHRAFQQRLTIHLGTGDTRQDAALNTSPGAMAQGAHRYARGLYFFDRGRAISGRDGVPFLWKKVESIGVGHDHARVAADAAAIFLAPPDGAADAAAIFLAPPDGE
jgi:hypothetical protein